MAATARKILHIDMDAFFAAVEQRDHPEYRGKPLIVGGDPNARGVVSTCSYEARQFGIHSAMPASRAKRLCPDGIFVRPRFAAYRSAAEQIRQIFRRVTPLVEPVSLDEAYLDVSQCDMLQGSATRLALHIKQEIHRQTGLTASAGVSYNKFLAKIASDLNKPDGLYVIPPEDGEAFVASLAIGRFHGIGKATEARMQQQGIHNGADLRKVPLARLVSLFGKAGQHYYHIARGQDDRPVRTSRPAKSMGNETTFPQDIHDTQELQAQLRRLFHEIFLKTTERGLQAFTITVKVKFSDFEQVTRSQTLSQAVCADSHTDQLLAQLLARARSSDARPVRLLGVTLSGFTRPGTLEAQGQQLELFASPAQEKTETQPALFRQAVPKQLE